VQVSGAIPLELTASSVEIRSRVLIAVVLRITGMADDALDGALESLMRQAPRFFENAPIVLDLEHAAGLERTADFAEITRRLQARKLTLLGVQGWSAEQRMAAIDAGLVALQKTGDRSVDLRERRDGAALAPQRAAAWHHLCRLAVAARDYTNARQCAIVAEGQAVRTAPRA